MGKQQIEAALRHIYTRVTALRILPVNNAGDAAAAPNRVPRPEITVDQHALQIDALKARLHSRGNAPGKQVTRKGRAIAPFVEVELHLVTTVGSEPRQVEGVAV